MRLPWSTLPEHIKQIRSFVKKNDEDYDISEKLKAAGWERFYPRDYSGYYFFTSPCKNFIVKQNYMSTCYEGLRIPKYSVPTAWVKKTDSFYPWMLQPKVDVSQTARDTALGIFGAMLNKVKNNESSDFEDLHEGNVGMYKGKPVLIDW